MNKENLLKMADYIETIPQEQFNMAVFRAKEDNMSSECGSVGCIIGHCAVLDPENSLYRHDGCIKFGTWSEKFTGIDWRSDDWNYLFEGEWLFTDNTPIGAAKRIRHYVEHGLPEDWEEQMQGEAPLSYM